MPEPSDVRLGREVYIAPTAYVGGNVTLGDNCTVMHQVTIRGDVSPIRLGHRCNVQDGTVIHTKWAVPLDIGDEVTIGHRAVVHGRRVGSRVLIGIGAIVLDDCEIGDDCLIGAGTVLAPATVVPAGKLALGMPGRVVRDLTHDERQLIHTIAERYVLVGRLHQAGQYPNVALGAGRPEGKKVSG